jgi:O-glycosyl hydrolase
LKKTEMNSLKANMKRIQTVVLPVLVILIILGCNKKKSDPEERPKDDQTAQDSLKILPEGSEVYQITVDPSVTFQEIDNFGASDCWSVQYVGNWPTSKTNQMADWLFSMDTTNNGQPLGIGLSAWRFNIGAGSAEQGAASGITDEWRRSECFLLPDGSYNWDKQSGQRWFLKAAHERGVVDLIGFSNSPPVHMTKNGKAYGSKSDRENISLENLDDFAGFLAEVSNGLKLKTGIQLDMLSPMNEPQWDWTSGSQEGCFMYNSTFRELIGELDARLSGQPTKILITEAGEWPYLYANDDETGEQIEYFFGSDSPVKDAPNLAKIIGAHSYYTTTPESRLVSTRESVWNKATTIPGLSVWSTEYCPLGNGDLEALGWSSWQRDLTMHLALYVAKIIYHDLVYANASAWQWWLAISPYDYPDGLIYVSKDKFNGTFSDSRLMWTLGNFSRFVRPGAVRIQTVSETSDLYAISFTHEVSKARIIILINPGIEAQPVKLSIKGTTDAGLKPFVTSDKENHKLFPMKSINISDAFEMPAECVITFTLKY